MSEPTLRELIQSAAYSETASDRDLFAGDALAAAAALEAECAALRARLAAVQEIVADLTADAGA